MKLSLSVRVAESFGDKTKADLPLGELADLAVDNGYHALCMRASQLGTHSSDDEVRSGSDMLSTRGLAVSMVTGDFPIPQNSDDEGPLALRDITPYLDLAEGLGCDLMRICMKTDDDIEWAQKAADEAAERDLRLAHQCHTSSLFEEVEHSLEVLQSVDRPNFGLIYEPVNLDACGQDYGRQTIEAFAPYLFNVYLQNHRENPGGEGMLSTWCRGDVHFDHIPIWEAGGMDFPGIVAALGTIGYDGYVTVHQAFGGMRGAAEAAKRSAGYLRSLGSFEDA